MSERTPAPAELALVQRFLNSVELDQPGSDQLATPAAYRAWLRSEGLIPEGVEVGEQDHQRALAVREALRGLTLANNGGPLYPVDLATLNQAAAEQAVRVRFLAAR